MIEQKIISNSKQVVVDKQLIWDGSNMIVIKYDIEGVIEYVNDECIEVFGYDEFELVGRGIDLLFHPDMPKAILKMTWDSIRSGHSTKAVVKSIGKNGRYLWAIALFELTKSSKGAITHVISKWRAIPDGVVSSFEVLYSKLRQIEKASSIVACEKYLEGYLEERYETYIEFLNKIPSQGSQVHSDYLSISPITKETQSKETQSGLKDFLLSRNKGYWDF